MYLRVRLISFFRVGRGVFVNTLFVKRKCLFPSELCKFVLPISFKTLNYQNSITILVNVLEKRKTISVSDFLEK